MLMLYFPTVSQSVSPSAGSFDVRVRLSVRPAGRSVCLPACLSVKWIEGWLLQRISMLLINRSLDFLWMTNAKAFFYVIGNLISP